MTRRAATAANVPEMRFTILCSPNDLALAARAAKYGVKAMPFSVAIVSFGGKDFYVKRTAKGGISVRQFRDIK